jgi:hypothetical protein
LIEGAAFQLLRKQAAECYRREGINHFENCEQVVDAYLAALSAIKGKASASS